MDAIEFESMLSLRQREVLPGYTMRPNAPSPDRTEDLHNVNVAL